MKIFRSKEESIRKDLSWDTCWNAPDKGLIFSWERGRQKRVEDPELATQAQSGQLVLLPWKGGVEKATKKGQKYGTLYYLAMWQGLRGDDLDIDASKSLALVCSVTGMTVVFTDEFEKYAEA